MSKKQTRNKKNSISSMVENTRRVILGVPSDETHSTGPVDTLILIILIIVGFLIYIFFKK